MKNLVISIAKKMLYAFYIFPIKNNRIVFSAYSGKQYSCNPKYISQWINHEHNGEYEIVWAFSNPASIDLPDKNIKKVKFKSLKYLYYVLTAKVIVDNVEAWSILPKRKGQLVLNTWHGGGAYKGVGLMRRDSSDETDKNMLKKNERVSVYLSSSKVFTNLTLRQSFHFTGKVLEVGMPRNDILLQNDQQKACDLKKKLGLDSDLKLVLYAPTFRKDTQYQYILDEKLLVDALHTRFGGKWKLLIRGHYYLDQINIVNFTALDVSNYPDMQELLLISDILITDYSSSMWDFSLMNKPGFLFMPDYSEYQHEREFYTPVSEWPYPACTSMNNLIDQIHSYNPEQSARKIIEHHLALGNCETGMASAYAGEKIIAFCQSK